MAKPIQYCKVKKKSFTNQKTSKQKKATREKQITYKGTPIRLSADFSTETLQARREWHDIFKVRPIVSL